ncbi:hypothetical protein KC315_g19546, partial [Hortaea werneckii]
TLIPIILSVCTSLNAIAAASRQAWALGRDQALPFSPWFRKIVTIGAPIPLNSILFSLTILIILALINIGSTAALNTIIALLTSATSFSYALSISCMLLRRVRGQPLPPARFSMGTVLGAGEYVRCRIHYHGGGRELLPCERAGGCR